MSKCVKCNKQAEKCITNYKNYKLQYNNFMFLLCNYCINNSNYKFQDVETLLKG